MSDFRENLPAAKGAPTATVTPASIQMDDLSYAALIRMQQPRDWSEQDDYDSGDVVRHGGELYLAIANSNNQEPPNAAYWREFRYHAILSKSDENYTVTDSDMPCVIMATAVTADRTITLPTAADNAGRFLYVVRTDTTAAYALIIDGEGAETIYNGGQAFATLEIEDAAAYEVWKLWCDGSNWYKLTPPRLHNVIDPGTGWFASKTTGWTADDFDNGFEVDFSDNVPIGTLAIYCLIYKTGVTGYTIYWRKSGDSNISNNPATDEEHSHVAQSSEDTSAYVAVWFWLSPNRKVQFAVQHQDVDLYIAYPTAYVI